jgi:anti-sigma regulatory factor (Ser/Thr protein kinase)
VYSDRIAITLTHAGKPFDPRLVPTPDFEGTRECGFGVYLIKRCVENVSYACDEKGINQITLVKERAPTPGRP